MDIRTVENKLREIILPELERGRPNWDKPHTEGVVAKLREIVRSASGAEINFVVLLIAAYVHDWGYADLFRQGQSAQLDKVREQKAKHAEIGAGKLLVLLEEPEFDDLTREEKERALHLVRVHDGVSQLQATDEIILMEADTLAALDVRCTRPSFDKESNQQWLIGVLRGRIPKFVNEFSKREATRLMEEREAYYRNQLG